MKLQMTRNWLAFLFFGTVIAVSGIAHGETRATKQGPCKKLVEACRAAGFVKGAHKETGKGLFVDCLGKLMKGESVAGVNVSQEDVSACKKRKAKQKQMRKARQKAAETQS